MASLDSWVEVDSRASPMTRSTKSQSPMFDSVYGGHPLQLEKLLCDAQHERSRHGSSSCHESKLDSPVSPHSPTLCDNNDMSISTIGTLIANNVCVNH